MAHAHEEDHEQEPETRCLHGERLNDCLSTCNRDGCHHSCQGHGSHGTACQVVGCPCIEWEGIGWH